MNLSLSFEVVAAESENLTARKFKRKAGHSFTMPSKVLLALPLTVDVSLDGPATILA